MNNIREKLIEVWNRAREMIKNENELINQRLSWMFAAQAFLFAALVLGIKLVVDTIDVDYRILIMLFLLPVIYLGFFSTLTAFRMVRDADNQRRFAAKYWKKQSCGILNLNWKKIQEEDADVSKGEKLENKKFEKAISEYDLPIRVHGEDLRTAEFGKLKMIPWSDTMTRDHKLPLLMSWAWIFVLVLWITMLLWWWLLIQLF